MAIVSYTRMADMTEADLQLVNADLDEDARKLPDRLMAAVAELERFRARSGSAASSTPSSQPPARTAPEGTRSTWRQRCSMTSATRSRPTPTATW
jgi:hypothetical protein